MILQEKDYIKKQKAKYLKGTLFWTALVICIFVCGLMIMKKRESYFTVFAGVLVIGAALNVTRLIGFGKYKDGDVACAEILEGMKGSYDLFHSAIIPDTRGTTFFEHIVITSKSLYFITYSEECVKKNRLWLENKMESKGIAIKNVHVVKASNEREMKNLAVRIERDACYTSGKQNEYTTIINGMLM